MIFKAITLYQPLATLAVLGFKPWETRNRPTKHRGPLVIHAGQRMWEPNEYSPQRWERIAAALARAGIEPRIAQDTLDAGGLPMGCIVGVVDVTDCQPAPDVAINLCMVAADRLEWARDALAFGDYGTGRFAWKLERPWRPTTPVRAKGKMGFWTVEPDGYAARVLQSRPALGGA